MAARFRAFFPLRLEKPSACPDTIYEMMKRCWANDPEDRPKMQELVDGLASYRGNDYVIIWKYAQNQNGNADKSKNRNQGEKVTSTEDQEEMNSASFIDREKSNFS